MDIPPGVEDGMKVKIPGSGDMPLSTTGPPGDLFVRVNVRSSPVFRRQGTNLYHDAKVQLHTALLGGKVRIPTLEGDVEVRVREGTQNGEEAVLKGRGVKSVYGGRDRGDLVVGWRVQIPRCVSTTGHGRILTELSAGHYPRSRRRSCKRLRMITRDGQPIYRLVQRRLNRQRVPLLLLLHLHHHQRKTPSLLSSLHKHKVRHVPLLPHILTPHPRPHHRRSRSLKPPDLLAWARPSCPPWAARSAGLSVSSGGGAGRGEQNEEQR